nr:hypothetical protein [Tanacetum cinerariifolium]
MHGEHDHPGNPEENDVEAGDQHVGRVEGLQEIGLLRPAQSGEGPQARTEPGVEYVVVLLQRNVRPQVVLGAHLGFVAADIDLARFVVPGRNAVAPPELTADAPVLNVTHPGEVHVFVLFGHERDATVFNGSDGRQGAVDGVVQGAVEVEHLSGGQHVGVLVEDVQQRQVVALADFVVVEVVSRGDLHAAGAEFRIAVIVRNDR